MNASTQFSIRPLEAGDIANVARFCFPDSSPGEVEERLRDELAAQQAGRSVTLLAVGKGVLGALTFMPQDKIGWLHNIAVRAEQRRQGIARALLVAAAALARERGIERLALHARASNAAAIGAYEQAGFRFAGADGMRGEQLRYEKWLRGGANGDAFA